MDERRKRLRLTSAQIIIIGFLGVILLGGLLLCLPCATRGEGRASLLEALFTATSSVCVTGLVVQNTATYWSAFGQTVILLLIQIGGMGVVTVAVTITMISGKKIGLMQRSTMQEAISAHHVGGIVKMTGFILKTTLLVELIGAALLAPAFCRDFGVLRGLWYALFHSVSAFCNAGFDLLGVEQSFVSLTAYAKDPLVNLTIMALIIVGGIGFLTWEDVISKKWRLKAYRMQSKVILVMALVLILLPAVYLYFCEFSRGAWANAGAGERALASLFQAVTPRTAGFNTVDLNALSETGQGALILLMLIGGAPGSTAGGMKTTTLAVLISCSVAVFRKRANGHFFGRRIADETVKNAVTVFLMYITLFLTGGMVISAAEGLPLLTCLFESASAVGTVGLSLGITPGLGTLSRLVLIVLMFFGRVGGLTLIFATLPANRNSAAMLPLEKITVG